MTRRPEHRTVVEFRTGADSVRILTDYAPHIRRMHADAAYRHQPAYRGLIVFEIDRDRFEPLNGRRRNLSPEERAARTEKIRQNSAAFNASRSKATPANFAALAALPPGMSQTAQAAALGVSRSTIQRLHRLRGKDMQ